MKRRLGIAIWLFVTISFAGCGSGAIKPKGRITKNGAPFKPTDQEVVHVVFFPDAGAGQPPAEGSFSANFNRGDGTFQLMGPNNTGVPKGTYRIAISIISNRKDILNGAYGPDKTPFVRTIQSGSDSIDIDLSNPK